MKAILMSIKPKWVAKILNGKKTIEIRKKFPSDFVGWVYIYCTKGRLNLIHEQDYNEEKQTWEKPKYYLVDYGDKYSFNSKVVARFWCDKVEEIACNCLYNGVDLDTYYMTEDLEFDSLEKQSCLTNNELRMYLGIGKNIQSDIVGYAIPITKLEIFDKPKELSEFKKRYRSKGYPQYQNWYLTKAPQSFMYIDID